MAFSVQTLILAAAIPASVFLLSTLARFLHQTRRPKSSPPGPPTILGLGNLHQIPLQRPFLKFHEWSKTYGDIISLKLGPRNLVVISSPAYVRELFQKRGAKYSGRPYSAVPLEHIIRPKDQHILFQQDDAYLRRWRSAVRHILSPEGVEKLAPLQGATGQKLVHDVLREPEEFIKHSYEWSLATPLLAIAGQRVEDYGPGFAQHYLDIQHDWLEILEPSNTPPVDIFPVLGYVPEFMAEWKKRARRVQRGIYSVYYKLLSAAKERKSTGQFGLETLFTRLLRERDSKSQANFTDDELALMAGGLLDAAVDTTVATLQSMLLCLVAHPEELQKVQKEIDSVCSDRCPQPEDTQKMPYLNACLMEVFRWRPPPPVGLPHLLTEDDIFQGYTIPKGSTVIANTYTIHLRSEDYDRPGEFLPERFLENPYGTKSKIIENGSGEGRLETYAFGAGRRICPGIDFAKTSILIAASKLLWACDLSYDGVPDVSWETGYGAGLASSPLGFKPQFNVKSEARRQAVEQGHQSSEEYLKKALG